MRRFGQFIAALGLVLGTFVALSLFLPLTVSGWSWLIAVGMVKLSLLSSLGCRVHWPAAHELSIGVPSATSLLTAAPAIDVARLRASIVPFVGSQLMV